MEKYFFLVLKKIKKINSFQHTSYADIEGMLENGYEGMPPVQEKTPSLPSRPLNLA